MSDDEMIYLNRKVREVSQSFPNNIDHLSCPLRNSALCDELPKVRSLPLAGTVVQ